MSYPYFAAAYVLTIDGDPIASVRPDLNDCNPCRAIVQFYKLSHGLCTTPELHVATGLPEDEGLITPMPARPVVDDAGIRW